MDVASAKAGELDLSDFGLGKWRAALHEESPLKDRSDSGLNTYSPHMKELRNVSGVYLWLYHIDTDAYRFIHVGMTTSCFYARTTAHCRYQFTRDRVYAPSFGDGLGPFGLLGDDLRPELSASNLYDLERKAHDFLAKIRVLYLIPDDVEASETTTIRQLEGAIARHASNLLNGKTTNTLSSTSSIDTNSSLTAEKLAERINRIAHCLPSTVAADEY